MESQVIGLDVGKIMHAATVMAADGTIRKRRTVAQNESALRAFLTEVRQDGSVTRVVDQCASIGQMVCAVAHDLEIPVQYLPGSTLRAVADTFPGQTKTDQRDADIIATDGRTMPHAIRPLPPMHEDTAAIKMVTGQLTVITQVLTRNKNQLRGLLHDVHPPLEQLVGPRLDQAGVSPMLLAWPTPQALGSAADDELMAFLRQHGSRRASTLVTELRMALSQQTLIMPGTAHLGMAITWRAQQCLMTLQEKRAVTRKLEGLLAVHPTAQRFAIVASDHIVPRPMARWNGSIAPCWLNGPTPPCTTVTRPVQQPIRTGSIGTIIIDTIQESVAKHPLSVFTTSRGSTH